MFTHTCTYTHKNSHPQTHIRRHKRNKTITKRFSTNVPNGANRQYVVMLEDVSTIF